MKQRRAFAGILSTEELRFVRDEPSEELGFDALQLRSGLRERDPKSRAALVWGMARVAVLRDWIRRHPGTRPPCWWAFDAPEPLRAMVEGKGEPALFDLKSGRATHWQGWTRKLAIESQASYLRRHGLMTAGEQRRVPKEGWEPEPIFGTWKFGR